MCSPAIVASAVAHGPADNATGLGAIQHGDAAPSAPTETRFTHVIDLTHPLAEGFPSANGEQWLALDDFLTFEDNGINFKRWSVHEHIGTHIDAPVHFCRDGATVDQIPIRSLVVPLVVVDIRSRAAENPDTELTPDDLAAWEGDHGEIPDGCCVAMDCGWDQRAHGPQYRNADDDGVMHFPGFHAEAAEMLLQDRCVIGIGVDTLSVDNGRSTEFPVHRLWLPAGRWAVEGLANLSGLPPVGATVVIGAPTIVGGTGGPSRILALC